MGKVEKYEKLNKPGLWFVRSIQPAKELGRYVYELTVELGRTGSVSPLSYNLLITLLVQ